MWLGKLKSLLARKYYPLNKIEISRKNLLFNYHYLTRFNPSIKIAAVLKSNAYGHGLKEIAKILDQVEPAFFCVDSLFEAYQLLKAKIKTKILIMGYIDPRSLKIKKLPFSFAIYDLDYLKKVHNYQPQAGFHLFVDTGMHREGIPIEELPQVLSQIKKIKNLKIEGIMSHLAAGKKFNHPQTKKQIENFGLAKKLILKNGFKPKWFHLCASNGLLFNQKLGCLGNLARVGLAFYGLDPQGENVNLRPVLKLTTKIAQIKTLNKGEGVGYDFSFQASKKMRIGVLPIGYHDGVDYRLGNKGVVLVGKHFCPIIGKISMNIMVVDLSLVKKPRIGQEVIIFSDKPFDKNSIQETAKLCQTIPYEILVHLSSLIKREVKD